ncbi:MAG: EamA family transporter, partial [Planctomycetota bacterium]
GHYAIQHGAAHLASYPAPVYDYALILALVGTVLPSLTLGAGLRRAGPQRFAVIGTIGPVTTVILAWLVLAEMPTLLQLVGFGCTLAGGLWVSLVRSRPARHGEGALAIGTAGSRCRAGSPAWQQRSRPPR